LKIDVPRYDKRIDFLSDFHGLKLIENKVNRKMLGLDFSKFPTNMDDVINIANKRLNMPPKSTWFRHKPLEGLIAYDFG